MEQYTLMKKLGMTYEDVKSIPYRKAKRLLKVHDLIEEEKEEQRERQRRRRERRSG